MLASGEEMTETGTVADKLNKTITQVVIPFSIDIRIFKIAKSTGVSYAALVFTLALCLTSCQNSKNAMTPVVIGTVTASEGFPNVVRLNQTYILDKQARIYEGDIVTTDSKSRLNIIMIDGSALSFGTSTKFVFHQYARRGINSRIDAKLAFTTGTFRARTSGADQLVEPKFEIRTPLAVIDARHADFWGGFLFSDKDLDVTLIKGDSIDVANSHGSVEITTAEYGTTIQAGSAPQSENRWSQRKLDQALKSTLFLGLD